MWELYENRLYAYGKTERDRQLTQAREDFRREAVHNPSYHKALRNGVEEEFLIQRTDKTERFKITAFPGNELNIGDYIEVFDQTFLVYQTIVQDTLNITGVIWLCNHKFRWQSFDSNIVERWGILDSGVYSTTLKGDSDLRYTNKQYKLILPLDNETAKLHLDKRLAVDSMFDKFGNKIINVYQITGYDATSENFGKDAHILYCNLQSDEYDKDRDSIEHMICDYIAPKAETISEKLICDIEGSSTIRAGTRRKYTGIFYDNAMNEVQEIAPAWSVTHAPFGVNTTVENNKLVISVDDVASVIGEHITIELSDESDEYITKAFNINIIGL